MWCDLLVRVFVVVLAIERCCVSGNPAAKDCPEPCSLLRDCDVALKILMKPRLENEERATVQSSFCGYDNARNLKVCCPTVKSRLHPNVALLPSKCGINNINRVYGGNATALKEFPWMALISMDTKDGPRFVCGGSVISPRYVLTAAHCVPNSKKVLGVRVGEHNLLEDHDCEGAYSTSCSEPVQDIPKESVILHPSYTSGASDGHSRAHDIALIRLKHDIDLSRSNAAVVCLPTTRDEQQRDLRGLSAIIAGWGTTENGTNSDILRKAYVPLYSKDECFSFYERWDTQLASESAALAGRKGAVHWTGLQRRHVSNVACENVPGYARTSTATFLCAGMKDVDTCQGDSGGPLVVSGRHGGYSRYIQYGVASFGKTKCGSSQPSLYTDVVQHMAWILDTIQP